MLVSSQGKRYASRNSGKEAFVHFSVDPFSLLLQTQALWMHLVTYKLLAYYNCLKTVFPLNCTGINSRATSSAASTLKHHYGGAQVPLKVPSVCIGHDGLCCSHHCQPWASVAGSTLKL